MALALRLVRESAAARAEIAGRFRYILVDEFQDTNRAQAELVGLLAEPHRNVTVVGDDDQAIYAFRGAAVDNILGFRERYRSARTVVLRRNYRSKAPILDAAYRLVRFNDPERLEVRAGVSKRLRAERADPGAAAVTLEAFATASDEADWIVAEIGRRIAAGRRPRDHAILVRANGHADPFLRALNLAGIPWRFSGTSGLYARPEIRLLLAFLRVVAEPESSVDLYALATSEVYGLGGDDLTAIVNMARRRNRSIREILEELDRQPGILRVGTRDPRDRPRGSSRTCVGTGRSPMSGRPGSSCTGSCGGAACWRDWPAPTRSPRRRRSATSRGSSRSSGASRRSSPTTGRSSSRGTSRRSSRPATIRPRPNSIPTPMPWPS